MYLPTNELPGWVQSDSVSGAFSLAQQAFQCFEKLVELSQQVIKATLAESEEAWLVATSGKTPVELWVFQVNAVRPVSEKALWYYRQLLGIATDTQAEFLKFIETRLEHHNIKRQAVVDRVARDAPAGSEAAVTVLKSTVSSTGIAYDAVLKAAQAIAKVQGKQALTSATASGFAKPRDNASTD